MRTAGCFLALALSLLAPGQRILRPRPINAVPRQGLRAGQPLPTVLRRALQAADSLRYTGHRVVTVLKDGQPNRHEEIVMREGPYVRIEFPREGSYSGQVIVENGAERRHFLPGPNEVRVLPPRREEGLQRLRALARTGGITTEIGDRIAGYPTVEVVVRDRAGNLLQRLAVEPNSGMVLRRRLFDATGVEVGGFEFTRADLDPAPFDPALFRIDRKGAKTVTPYDKLRSLAKKSGFADASLPPSTGFRLDTVAIRPIVAGGVLVQNYVGPGGRLSLYELRTAVNPDALRRQGGKRLNSLSWTDRGVTFVLLGAQTDAVLARLRDAVGR